MLWYENCIPTVEICKRKRYKVGNENNPCPSEPVKTHKNRLSFEFSLFFFFFFNSIKLLHVHTLPSIELFPLLIKRGQKHKMVTATAIRSLFTVIFVQFFFTRFTFHVATPYEFTVTFFSIFYNLKAQTENANTRILK